MTYLFGRDYRKGGFGCNRDMSLALFLTLDRSSEGLEDAHRVSLLVSRHVEWRIDGCEGGFQKERNRREDGCKTGVVCRRCRVTGRRKELRQCRMTPPSSMRVVLEAGDAGTIGESRERKSGEAGRRPSVGELTFMVYTVAAVRAFLLQKRRVFLGELCCGYADPDHSALLCSCTLLFGAKLNSPRSQ